MKLRHFLLLNSVVLFFSCTTLEKWQANPTVQFAETEAIKLAASYLNNGGNTNTLWGISEGLNAIGDIATFQHNQTNSAEVLKSQVKAFANDQTEVNTLAVGLANVLPSSASASVKAAVVLNLAKGIQLAAISIK